MRSADWLARERQWLARVRAGDLRAFGELYRAFAGRLYTRVLLPRLGEPAAAEEALSETFRSALERLDQFDDRGDSIWFWLLRIAVNKATDVYRARARTGRALVSFEALLTTFGEPAPEPPVLLEAEVEAERLRRAVADVLSRIHPRYRRAIELRFLEDRPRTDCAEALGVALGTFDVVLLRALRAFRTAWERQRAGKLGEAEG